MLAEKRKLFFFVSVLSKVVLSVLSKLDEKPSIVLGCPGWAPTTVVFFSPSAYLLGKWCGASNHLGLAADAHSHSFTVLVGHYQSVPCQQSHVSMSKYCCDGAGAAVGCALAPNQSGRQGGLRGHCLCRQAQVRHPIFSVPKRLLILKYHTSTGYLNSETPGDSTICIFYIVEMF